MVIKKRQVKRTTGRARGPREADRLKRKIKRLEQKREQGKFQVELWRELSGIARKDFSPERFLDRMMSRVVAATRTESATLFLLNESEQTLEFAVVKGPGARKLKGKVLPAGEGIVGLVVRTSRPYLSAAVEEDPHWSPRVARELGQRPRNLLAVPLKIGGKTQGAIEVINKKDGAPFSKEDLEFLQVLAAQAAVLLENTRLFGDAKRAAERFATLSRLSAILNSTLDPKEVRKRAMEAAVELLECETGSLYLIDAEKKELYFEVALGEKGEAVKEIRLKMGEGIAGWVAKEGKSDLVPDTRRDPRWASRVDEKSKFQTRNMVTVPVKARDQVIGVLQALNKLHGKKFDTADLRLLENLADQVAIALENARLYEEQKVMFKETAQALATAIEKRDPYTGGHTKRVRDFCLATVKYLDLDPHTREWLELAAILHDVGKIGVDDQILRKPDRLSNEEFEKMKPHPVYGWEILQHVKPLAPAIPGMKHHHERYDGRGYPDGLAGPQIPLIARIIAVADTWDAMTSDRPYRKGLSDETAAQELQKFSGIQFDPQVVEAFLQAYHHGEIVSQHQREDKCAVPAPAPQAPSFKPRGCLEEDPPKPE